MHYIKQLILVAYISATAFGSWEAAAFARSDRRVDHCDDAALRLECAVVESRLSASNSAVGDLEPDPIRRLAELPEADAHAAADRVAAPAVRDERLFGAIRVP